MVGLWWRQCAGGDVALQAMVLTYGKDTVELSVYASSVS